MKLSINVLRIRWLSKKVGGGYLNFVGAIIGLISFYIIYGSIPLSPTNDSWIMAGYDESDIIQHYSGWLAFRNSEWSFPLGLAKDMAIEDGTYISFTDSIPWVAIFFKLFNQFLPETFQYFGLYVFLCFILQGIASINIFKTTTRNTFYSVMGSIILCFSPILLERAFRHSGLGSQWLILFSILIFLQHRNNPNSIHYIFYAILLGLAIGIHPYFLPMVALFMGISVIEDLKERKHFSLFLALLALLLTYGLGLILGVLGTGVSPSRWGYGYFSMNLNAVINPISCGKYNWSSIFKQHEQVLGNYDGFNYLGAGVFLGLFLLIIFTIVFRNIQYITCKLKRNSIFTIAMLLCSFFAISNVISLNGKILYEIPIPHVVEYICGIFRASSRLFYPVYYCIIIITLSGLFKFRSQLSIKKLYFLIGLICFMQFFDIHYCISEKHRMMQRNANYISILNNNELNDILSNSKNVLLDEFTGNKRVVAVIALKNNNKLYYSTANSGNYTKTNETAQNTISRIKQTGKIEKNIIVTTNINEKDRYLLHRNLSSLYVDGMYFIYEEDNKSV